MCLSWCGGSIQVTSNAWWDRSHGQTPPRQVHSPLGRYTLPPWAGTPYPPGQVHSPTPRAGIPPGQVPPRQAPLGKCTPPGQVPPSGQAHPPGRHTPQAGTPPERYTPQPGTPPRQVHPPIRCPPGRYTPLGRYTHQIQESFNLSAESHFLHVFFNFYID